jgi:hypothetical protein
VDFVHPHETPKVIEDFPKDRNPAAYEHIRELCTRGLENCVQLRCCKWTRDGSLTSRTLKSLGTRPGLTDISINGKHDDFYEPGDLLQLLRLRKISLIEPSISIFEILPIWFQATGKSLTSLSLTCEVNYLITDALLHSMSPHLSRLEHLHLSGYPSVTNEGIWSMIGNRVQDLKELSLGDLSPFLNMSALSADCARAGGLTSLYSFTFTVHPHWSSNPHWSTNGWMDGVVSLLKDSPLESVQFNATELFPVEGLAVILGDRLCMRIVDQHRDHLIRFSLHGLQLGLPSIDHVCLQCEKLEQLFICVDHATTDMVSLTAALMQAKNLRAVHVKFNMQPEGCSPYIHALNIARQCSPTISQVGICSRVWKVERQVFFLKGTAQVDRFLVIVEHPDIPEKFLVHT